MSQLKERCRAPFLRGAVKDKHRRLHPNISAQLFHSSHVGLTRFNPAQQRRGHRRWKIRHLSKKSAPDSAFLYANTEGCCRFRATARQKLLSADGPEPDLEKHAEAASIAPYRKASATAPPATLLLVSVMLHNTRNLRQQAAQRRSHPRPPHLLINIRGYPVRR